MEGLTGEEEDAQGPELCDLAEEERRLTDAVTDMRLPQSLAGITALAKAIMAISEIEDDGNLIFEHGNTVALATVLTLALAESEVVA